MWVWPDVPARKKRKEKEERVEILSPLAQITRSPHGLARGSREKKIHFCILVTFFLNFYMNITNFCTSEKYKFYVFLNMLNFLYGLFGLCLKFMNIMCYIFI